MTHVGKQVQSSDAFVVHGHLLEHLQVAAVEAVGVLLRARGKHGRKALARLEIVSKHFAFGGVKRGGYDVVLGRESG